MLGNEQRCALFFRRLWIDLSLAIYERRARDRRFVHSTLSLGQDFRLNLPVSACCKAFFFLLVPGMNKKVQGRDNKGAGAT